MRLLSRLYLTLGLTLFVVFASALLIVNFERQTEVQLQRLEKASQLHLLLSEMKSLLERFIDQNDPRILDRWRSRQERAEALFEQIDTGYDSNFSRLLFSAFDTAYREIKEFQEFSAANDTAGSRPVISRERFVARWYHLVHIESLRLEQLINAATSNALEEAVQLERRQTVLVIASTATLLLIILLIWTPVLARLRSAFHELKGAADRIDSGDLDARVRVTGNDEIASIGTVMNRIAERFSTLLERERTVVADLERESRKRGAAEAELSRSEERYRRVFRNNPLPMWIYEADSLRFIDVNLRAIADYGYSRDEFLSMRLADITLEKEGTELVNRAGHNEGFTAPGVASVHRTKDGRHLRVESYSENLVLNGQAARIVIALDVGERERYREQIESLNRRLRRLSQKIITSQEEERQHLARELHDDVLQKLAMAKIGLHLQIRDIRDSSSRESLSQTLTDSLDGAISSLRDLSQGLRPPKLDSLGLKASLQDYLTHQAQLANLTLEFDAESFGDALDPTFEISCYRIVQEGMHNIVKHADASHVRFRLWREDQQLKLCLEDDGKGFDHDSTGDSSFDRQRMGLAGMQERAAIIGAHFEILSRRGSGTRLFLQVPADNVMKSGPD